MHPSFTLPSIRRQAYILAYFGDTQLLIFVGSAAYNFWWGGRILLLNVQAHEIASGRPPLSQFIDSPVGAYFTGTKGTLVYRAESLGDHLLFYSLGGLTIVDALYASATGLFLCWVLLGLRADREFSARLSWALTIVGAGTVAMHLIRSFFDLGIARLFEARTHSLFYLIAQPANNSLYIFMGILLLACAQFLRRGKELQQEIDLTI